LVEMFDQVAEPLDTLPQFGMETVGVLTVLGHYLLTFREPTLGLLRLGLTVCGVHGDPLAPPAHGPTSAALS